MTAVARSDFRYGVSTLLDAQSAATPTLLRHNERLGPANMAEKPASWQGEIASLLAYDIGTRQHVMTMRVQVATTFPNDTAPDDFDDLMDALVERFSLNSNAAERNGKGPSVLSLTAIEPSPYTILKADGSSQTYRGALLTVQLEVWENRL